MECNNNNTVKRGSDNPIYDHLVINDHGTGGSSTPIGDNSVLGLTCDSSVAVGDLVYINGSGVAIKAQANSVSTSNVAGLIIDKASSTSCTLLTCGYATGFTGLTPGAQYYLSNSTSGNITTSFPTTTGQVIAPVAKAYSSTAIVINIQTRIVRG